jgi:hypothetical protein
MEIGLGILCITNLISLYWAFFQRGPKVDEKILSIHRAIKAFEKDGDTLLQITRIDPDSVFLRNISR